MELRGEILEAAAQEASRLELVQSEVREMHPNPTHPAPYTLHPTPYILPPAPYPYPLAPTPYTFTSGARDAPHQGLAS